MGVSGIHILTILTTVQKPTNRTFINQNKEDSHNFYRMEIEGNERNILNFVLYSRLINFVNCDSLQSHPWKIRPFHTPL